ncbi:MAG: response regulator transcription factor [Rubrobacteraceae bacterium]
MTLEEAVEYALGTKEPFPPPASQAPRADTPSTILTPREREVAILLARGLPDRAVARELSISERTVTTHVGKILRKLNFQSRSQVAAWVVEQRLLPLDQG